MKIKKARQILKSFADDTRLRIIHLLSHQELNVTELCKIINKNQSNLSKHLLRLRLTGIVGDKRRNLNVYYYLIRHDDKIYKALLDVITRGFSELEAFEKDLEALKELRRRQKGNLLKGGMKK